LKRTALIVGGGIAGIACAVRLAERGVAVTLLETRKKLGGRATSFQDVRSGEWLDNCQHVVLGCCTNYLDLLRRLGVAGKIVWHRRQHWIEVGGRESAIGRGLLPAPLHFAGSFIRAKFLTLEEKNQIARACRKILRTDRRAWANRTFGEFLAGCAQGDRVVRRFWAPVVVSACNLDPGRVSAAAALHVFQEGFLASKTGADLGVPSVPLLDLYDGATALIEKSGGQVHLGAGVERLDEHGAVTTAGKGYEADAVVCAVPVERVAKIVDEATRARDSRFARLEAFAHSPILGVHLRFDRPVMPRLPHAVLVEPPHGTQWLFRKDAEGKYLHAVISAADQGPGAGGNGWMGLSEDQIGDCVLEDIRACLPDSTDPLLLSVRAVKEKFATFAPTPGVESIRPRAVGESKIVLAGDYTDTGWPATMEGAARSGYIAAATVLGIDPHEVLVPSLPTAPLAKVMALKA